MTTAWMLAKPRKVLDPRTVRYKGETHIQAITTWIGVVTRQFEGKKEEQYCIHEHGQYLAALRCADHLAKHLNKEKKG